MRYRSLFSLLAVALLMGSCSDEKAARQRLNIAEQAYKQGELNNAKLHIDSIKVLFPKEFKVMTEGLTLLRTIELDEQERNIVYCDSMLQEKLIEAEPLKKNLTLQKDTAYEEIGNWIYKQQTVERNVERCYIRSGVNEKGEIYLASVFYGKGKLNHAGIKVSLPNGEYAETESIPYDGGANYRFTDLGMNSEVVTYRQGKDNGVIDFIYNHPKERLKVEFKGGKPYTMYMDDQAKRALTEVYNLAVVLTDIERLKKEILLSQAKVEYLKKKLAAPQQGEEG